jgi:hypothetical protein
MNRNVPALGVLTFLALGPCFAAAQTANPVDLMVNKWCSGTNNTSGGRNVDMVVVEDGKVFVRHFKSKVGGPAYSDATEPMPAVVEEKLHPAEVQGSSIVYTTDFGYRFVMTPIDASTVKVAASWKTAYDQFTYSCREPSAATQKQN